VNVDSTGDITHRDNVDVVGRVGSIGRHSRSLYQSRETLAIAINGWVNPVTNRHSRASVRVSGVNSPSIKLRSTLD